MAQTDHCDRLLAIIDAQNEIVGSDLDLDAVMSLVAARAHALTGADAAVIEVTEGEELVCVGASGAAAPHVGTRLRRDSSLSGLCVELDRVLRSDYTTSADRRVDSEPWVRDGAGSVLCVPLRNGSGPLGTMKAYCVPPGSFGAEDEQTLELLAGLAVAHLAHVSRLDGNWSDDRHDAVTGLPNRASYEQRLGVEAERARRYRYPLALLLVEIDGLAAMYDELGRRAGDDVVRDVAEVLNGSRFADEAFRIGDNEFAILLPHTDVAGAEAAAARLVLQISAAGVISASWGAASGEGGHPETLHERAARALVAARDGERYASAG